ncbi:MAG: hypothetical protein V4683_08445 [Bacteroidota bacterium]
MNLTIIKPILGVSFICFLLFSCTENNEIIKPNEANGLNEKSKNARIQAITYNEMLATLYRGILIPKLTAGYLNTNNGMRGYYKIKEFRVFGSPTKKAIALSILKHYGEMAIGPSVLPQSNENWVFTNFLIDIWTSNYRKVEVKDNFNHLLKMEMTWNTANSCWDTIASINNRIVYVSTQTYLGQIPNTCNFVEEPWTVF